MKEKQEQYQSFSQSDLGVSTSFNKLKKLGIPDNLEGKTVLDIGCNEGFFCFECERRKAKKVIGIDKKSVFFERALARKREFKSNVDFKQMDWDKINSLNEKFDLVLFLAAFHYVKGNQAQLLKDICENMNFGGRLILELGLSESNKDTFFIEKKEPKPDAGFCEYPNKFTIEKLLLTSGFTKVVHYGPGGIGKPKRFVIHALK